MKHKIFNWILKHYYKAPVIEDVFTNLSQEKKEQYALEAKQLLNSDFYKDFLRLMEQLAVNKMARDASTGTDMLFGKAVLFYVMTQRTKLKEYASYEAPKQGESNKW